MCGSKWCASSCGVLARHRYPVLVRRLGQPLAGLDERACLREDPGVALRAPGDHHRVHSGPLEHRDRSVGVKDVAAADDDDIELIGEYDNIYRWLWDAKKELGFVVVKEYAMSRRDNIDDQPRLLAEVSLSSYRAEQ